MIDSYIIMNKKNIFIIFSVVVLVAIIVAFLLAITSKTSPKGTIENSVSSEDAARIDTAKQNVVSLQEALSKDPQNLEIKRSLSRALLLSGDAQKAEMYIREVISGRNNDPQCYVDLGNIYFVQNEILKAEEQFSKAIDVFHQKPDLSQFGVPQGVSEEKLPTEIKDLINQKKPSVPISAYRRLADIYLRQNKLNEAITLLKEGTQLSPNYPDFYFMLSQAYTRLNDKDDATKYQKIFEELTSSYKRS